MKAGALRPTMRRFAPGLRTLCLSLLTLAALAIRCWQLGAAGFSEDEISKLRAVEAYRRLDFTANAEHPMLMKVAALASMSAAQTLNAHLLEIRGLAISPEAAFRFPNALAGALTTVCLFLLAEALFSVGVAWWAAVLWAVDINAIAIGRIGKEDSLLVLFLLLAAWCYERGKQAAPAPGAYSHRGQRWFGWAGAAFGLMAATKYMPYYFGLHVIFARAADPLPGLNRPDKPRYFGAMLVAFLGANVAIMLPQNWLYLFRYSTEQLMAHTGYAFAGKLYVNQMSATPFGLPSYFYVVYLLTKVPLAIVIAAAVGLVTMIQRPRERGLVFLRVFFVFILLPYSLIASKFVRYLLPLFPVLDIMAAVGIWRVVVWSRSFRRTPEATSRRRLRVQAEVAASLVILAGPIAAIAGSSPHFALYHNTLSEHVAGHALLFPHCELYDAGVREAAQLVAARAAPGAIILSEAPRVVEEYVHARRVDVRSRTLTHDAPPAGAEVWVLVQDGRIYYENVEQITRLRATHRAETEVRVGGVSAVQVFRLPAAPAVLHSSR